MKVIAGHYRGFNIPAPKGLRFRPTANRVREAVFSAIDSHVEGKTVLDLFAGSGAFGFEALSRNAKNVVFVDRSRVACANIKQVGERLGVHNKMLILNSTALKAVKKLVAENSKFSVIFLDPPYYSPSLDEILEFRDFPYLFSDDSLIICETSVRSQLPNPPPKAEIFFSRKYGETLVNIFSVVDKNYMTPL